MPAPPVLDYRRAHDVARRRIGILSVMWRVLAGMFAIALLATTPVSLLCLAFSTLAAVVVLVADERSLGVRMATFLAFAGMAVGAAIWMVLATSWARRLADHAIGRLRGSDD
ncbi:MAG: hypothetical protein ACAI43_05190 [Phycisphaerae bacterium]